MYILCNLYEFVYILYIYIFFFWLLVDIDTPCGVSSLSMLFLPKCVYCSKIT